MCEGLHVAPFTRASTFSGSLSGMSNVFARILAGVDDSNVSNQAVAFATRLAGEHGSQLIVCNSVNWLPLVTQLASSGAMIDPTPAVDDLKAEGAALLDRAVAAAARGGVTAQRVALEGDPARNLLEQAAEWKCSLIVMGTHGRQGLERLFVGSTTEAVLRGSSIPVLTVRDGVTPAAPHKRCFEGIVAGVDESEPSDAAVRTILALPAEDRRRVIFYSVAGAGEDEADRAHRVIAKAVAAANAFGISAKGRVIGGNPDEALIAAAQQQGADLIVLGSHGRHGLQRLFLGSVAEGVVRKSPLPVLVVRTPPDQPGALERDLVAAAVYG
jgi:nucleotide-binding universal stress UspA family protein